MNHELIKEEMNLNSNILREEPMAKEMPKYLDFTNQVYNELQGQFDIEQQVEILHSLYCRLKEKYSCELEHNLKCADDLKRKLEILNKLEPKH